MGGTNASETRGQLLHAAPEADLARRRGLGIELRRGAVVPPVRRDLLHRRRRVGGERQAPGSERVVEDGGGLHRCVHELGVGHRDHAVTGRRPQRGRVVGLPHHECVRGAEVVACRERRRHLGRVAVHVDHDRWRGEVPLPPRQREARARVLPREQRMALEVGERGTGGCVELAQARVAGPAVGQLGRRVPAAAERAQHELVRVLHGRVLEASGDRGVGADPRAHAVEHARRRRRAAAVHAEDDHAAARAHAPGSGGGSGTRRISRFAWYPSLRPATATSRCAFTVATKRRRSAAVPAHRWSGS